ncbi:RlpA-like double-psi beta-barrel-protein domain-containing protein-containing protein [Lentinula raphanica]|nr:RlpA-like double-psi beta-barrel-protein domain-containing protein-containing protein [Lentinula raphanica]
MFTSMLTPIVLAGLLSSSSLVTGRAIPIRKSLEGKRSVTVTDFTGGSGDGTFYDPGLGACGITNVATDMIAAIGEDFFDQYAIHMGVTSGNPNENPICNKKVVATYQGKSITVAITDRCGGCTNPYSLDFTETAFSQLADPSVGRITGVTWVFADSSDSGSSSGSVSGSSSAADGSSTTTDSSDGSTSSSASTDVNTQTTTSTDTWTSGTTTWTSVSSSPTSSSSTSTSSTSTITPGAVVNVGNDSSASNSATSSGFVTARSSSSIPPSGTLGGSNPEATQRSKQSSGARRSIRRLWEL